MAVVDTCPSDFDNNLEVFTGGCGALTSVGCNEDSSLCAGYWQASLSVLCTAGTTYLIYAGGYNGASGKLKIRIGLNNVAQLGTALLGTESSVGVDTPIFHEGTGANSNDGDLTTRADTRNAADTDPLSYVGVLWPHPQPSPVLYLQLTLATFGDGGWFGPNNQYPGPGGLLSLTYLTEPTIQVTTDSGATWTTVGHTSDYLTALNGHGTGGGAYPNPNSVTATFMLNTPAVNINGVRIIGSEGGVASGGFLGVFELSTFIRLPQPVRLLNPRLLGGQFQFDFDSQAGISHVVTFNTSVVPGAWQTLTTIQGDGTRKTVVDLPQGTQRFYRILSQ